MANAIEVVLNIFVDQEGAVGAQLRSERLRRHILLRATVERTVYRMDACVRVGPLPVFLPKSVLAGRWREKVGDLVLQSPREWDYWGIRQAVYRSLRSEAPRNVEWRQWKSLDCDLCSQIPECLPVHPGSHRGSGRAGRP